MKKYKMIIVCLFALSNLAKGQDATKSIDVDKVLSTYSKELDPYLQEIVDKEYDKAADKAMVRSRFMALKVNTKLIDSKIKSQVEKNGNIKQDKAILTKIIDNEYRNTYPGLSLKFFDQVHSEVNKI